jgi:tetratricopeptide (TPR) repeat protein
MFMGQLEESIHEISRAVELDPVSQAILKDKGFAHYYYRQYDKAIEVARKTLELDPNFFTVHRLLSLSYQGKKMFDEAIAENQQWGTHTRNELESSLGLAQLYAVSGRREEARNIVGNLESVSLPKGNLFRGMALVYVALGENDMAFKWLEKGYERRDESLCSLKIDPKMDNLHADPRFASLLRRIGLER